MGNRIDAHTPNTVLAKKGLTEVIEQLCNYQHLCVYSTDGFQMPLLRQYPNRKVQAGLTRTKRTFRFLRIQYLGLKII